MKKLLSIFVLMLMATIIHAQNLQIYLSGDANRDGKVTVADVMMEVNLILNGYTPFSVSPTAVSMFVYGTATIDIAGGYDEYEVISSNPGVVTATLNGSVVTLTGLTIGEAKVTIKDVLTMRFVEVLVMVECYSSSPSYRACPDDHHPHLIDLGLPSGTKWACCNMDTDFPEYQSPTNYGGYYAWGETETKRTPSWNYDWRTYIHCDDGWQGGCHDLGSDIAGTEYDVAHVKWGGSWVMPSKEQLDELINNCTYERTTVDGVNGVKFTSKTNDASIFLPAAGYFRNTNRFNFGSNAYYWLSTQSSSKLYNAYYFFSDSNGMDTKEDYRCYGRSVRPVVKK